MIDKIVPYTEWVHKKTGNTYTVTRPAINATNAQDDQIMVIYYNTIDKYFVREISEFLEKFERKFN